MRAGCRPTYVDINIRSLTPSAALTPSALSAVLPPIQQDDINYVVTQGQAKLVRLDAIMMIHKYSSVDVGQSRRAGV